MILAPSGVEVHTGLLTKKHFLLDFIFFCTGSRLPVLQKVDFLPTGVGREDGGLVSDDEKMRKTKIRENSSV